MQRGRLLRCCWVSPCRCLQAAGGGLSTCCLRRNAGRLHSMTCMARHQQPLPQQQGGVACRRRSQTRACCLLHWTSCTPLAQLQEPTALQRRPLQPVLHPLVGGQPHRQQLLTWRRSWLRAAAALTHLESQLAQVQAHLRLQQAPQIRCQPCAWAAEAPFFLFSSATVSLWSS